MKHTFFTLIFLLFISCSKDDNSSQKDYRAENEQEILDYISVNNLNAEKSNSGLYYVIDELGTGAQPTATSNVTVAYKGSLTNGNVFDQSDEAGISFNLQGVIPGWTEGITYFKEGGSGMLLIPAHLGYGGNSVGSIPPGSVLVFDIELISVN
jgi:FKBP-type peptidyl-prolyl cis-trans isomerase FkpA